MRTLCMLPSLESQQFPEFWEADTHKQAFLNLCAGIRTLLFNSPEESNRDENYNLVTNYVNLLI